MEKTTPFKHALFGNAPYSAPPPRTKTKARTKTRHLNTRAGDKGSAIDMRPARTKASVRLENAGRVASPPHKYYGGSPVSIRDAYNTQRLRQVAEAAASWPKGSKRNSMRVALNRSAADAPVSAWNRRSSLRVAKKRSISDK
jgi:hypothetical protein